MNDRNVPAPNTAIPFPVDLNRVTETIDELGYHFLSSDDRVIVPWSDHRVSMYFSHESGQMLTVLGRLRMSLDMFAINDAARAVTQWNAERIGPTALLHLGNDGEVELKFRTTICIDEGLSVQQLRQFLTLSLDTTAMAVTYILERFSELSFSGAGSDELSDEQDQSDLVEKISGLYVPTPVESLIESLTDIEWEESDMSDEDSEEDYLDDDTDIEWETDDDYFQPDPEDESFDDSDIPHEVTLDRIREQLHDIGVMKTSGEDDFIVAWINEIFLGFFVDNGPTLLVKGHWDPNMDATRDFMKLFMMCNQWNENSLTTKAFCHTDDQGLQVRVEFAVSVAEGLNDDQLQHNIALSIHHILQAVDSISKEATGKSVVEWPEKDN
nr:YbjN domain-containing protein [Corynebacterium suranareeae]